MSKNVRLRFAPSPTGYLHIGGLRTALYNYLYAKGHDGKFILRIEDTDQERYVEGALENLIRSLKWAGLDYDEGVYLEEDKIVQKGDYGPYIQSERLDIYHKYADQLIESGHAYYCFCKKDRLDEVREEQIKKGVMPKYDGFCRSIPLEEAKERIANGEEHVVRMKWPKNYNVTFHDIVRGNITINSDDSDDQVLMKSDGFPTYHMAVVIDDHLMEISHIVRGDEWLSSTPKHTFLYEAFGWEEPDYVHLPTVLNEDRQKLSKRHGDVSVEDFADRGYLAPGLINYLALVGWSPTTNEEILSMDDMIKDFSLDRVASTGGVFDVKKLDWVNAHYMRELPIDELLECSIPYMIISGQIDEEFAKENREWLKLLLETVQESLHRLDEVPERVKFIFDDKLELSEEAKEILKDAEYEKLIEGIREELETVDEDIDKEYASVFMKNIQKRTGLKGRALFMPTRILITGMTSGPELTNVLQLLGKENILKRLEQIESGL